MEGLELQEYRAPLTAVEVRAQVNLIQEVMGAVMKKDLHYGTIPGTQKPTLYKPGSEKLLSTFRISIQPEVEDLSFGGDFIRYRVTCKAYDSRGGFLGAGIGECSTDEEKYKWRGIVCEAEWESIPEDQRRLKFYRNGNQMKQIRTNPADLANTVLKMAKKRAQIDVTLTVTAASDIFDQDIEDLSPEVREAIVGGGEKKETPPVTRKSATKTEGHGSGKTPHQSLNDELEAYCGGNKALRAETLKEVSLFLNDKGEEVFMRAIPSEGKNDKWVGSALGNLRKLAAGKTSKPSATDPDIITPDDIHNLFVCAGYTEDQILPKMGTILQEPPKKALEDYSDQALREVHFWMLSNES